MGMRPTPELRVLGHYGVREVGSGVLTLQCLLFGVSV